MPRAFLSHHTPDRPFVEQVLVPLLQGHGIGTWYCKDEILGGDAFDRKIREGLKQCDSLVVVLTPGAVASEWVRREVHVYRERERHKPVIPVFLRDCDADELSVGLSALHFIDFRDTANPHAAGRELLRAWGIDICPTRGDPSEEALCQEQFLGRGLGSAVPDADALRSLLDFALGDDTVPAVVHGVPLAPRAAVLGGFVARLRQAHPEILVLPYFTAARPESASLDRLLDRFRRALHWRFGTGWQLGAAAGRAALVRDFRAALAAVPAGERVVLVLDGLDALDDPAALVAALPEPLPPGVKVVLGCDCDARAARPALPALHGRPGCEVRLPGPRPDAFRFAFLRHGSTVDGDLAGGDRLYLDVGNGLRAGAIDNHHMSVLARSSASLVLEHPGFVRAAVNPWRRPGDPFTVTAHVDPDLDCAAAAYLATELLAEGSFPDGAHALSRYADLVDTGGRGTPAGNPFSLHAAHLYLGHRLGRTPWDRAEDRWRQWLAEALRVVRFVVAEAVRQRRAVQDVDAFASPGLFTDEDRNELLADRGRYEAKLAAQATHARTARLTLPGLTGGEAADVPALLVRDVHNPGDPERCVMFKDWARGDERRAGQAPGFIALSVHMSRSGPGPCRCILSVTPESGLSLEGLGAELEKAEVAARTRDGGTDARLYDPASGARLPDRGNSNNPDPWYDGKEHAFTIVDAPRAGTVLAADEIEAIFLRYGRAAGVRAL